MSLSITSIPSRIKRYAQDRPDEDLDRAESSPLFGGITGGFEGLFTAGPSAALGGIAGGVAGTRVARKTDNFWAGLATGAVAGSGVAVGVAMAVAAALGAPAAAVTVLPLAVAGALCGAAGDISGGKSFNHRASQSGGFLSGSVARLGVTAVAADALAHGLLGGALDGVAGGVSAGIASNVRSLPARVLAAVALGAASGAALGIAGGPATMAVMGGIGAFSAAAGTLLGPAFRHLTSHFSRDVGAAGAAKLDAKFFKGQEWSDPVCYAVGAVSYLFSFGSMAALAALNGMPWLAPIPLAIGAAMGLQATHKLLHPETGKEATS